MFLNRGLSLMVHKTIHCQTACFSSLYVQQHAQSMFLVWQFMHILIVYIYMQNDIHVCSEEGRSDEVIVME